MDGIVKDFLIEGNENESNESNQKLDRLDREPYEAGARASSKIGRVMPVSINPGQMALIRTPVPDS